MKLIRFAIKYTVFVLLITCLAMATACDKNEGKTKQDSDAEDAVLFTGTGSFVYTGYAPLATKPITVFYHIPQKTTAQTPILVVFHGAGRDALESRDAMIDLANTKHVIVVVPEFSDEFYPGSDVYNMLNIFEDGESPSSETMNNKDVWTSAIIDPLFSYMKQKTDNESEKFDVFGHSAGAQVAHRFLFFAESVFLDRVVSASAGWYTLPDLTIDFPYGLNFMNKTSADITAYFGKKMYVIVGENDTDPNSYNLRHNVQADAQGNTRLERAQYFYSQAQAQSLQLGVPLAWQYKQIPNAGHDFELTSAAAMNILY